MDQQTQQSERQLQLAAWDHRCRWLPVRSHADWQAAVIHLHDQEAPFAPENGSPLRFSVGDPVIYANASGALFSCRIRALYAPEHPCSLYAMGARYLLDGFGSHMPVAEAELMDVPRH